MKMLGRLICGPPAATCLANTTLNHVAESIDMFAEKTLKYLGGDYDEESRMFAAFCARVLLENSCAALVSRLDPFRMLYLAEMQNQATFDHGVATRSGFRWTGDVIPEVAPAKLWSADHEFGKVSRALLGDYSNQLYWTPALNDTLDAFASVGENAPHELTRVDSKQYAEATRGRCLRIYSTLSKGVHWEYFVSSVVLDEGTVKDTIRDCLVCICSLGLISHFVPTAYRSLDGANALQAYKDFRSTFV